jgi:hypothetical protein
MEYESFLCCAWSWTRVRYSFLVPNRNGENVSENRFASNEKKRVFSVILHVRAKLNEQGESGASYHGQNSKDLVSRSRP